MKNIFYTNPTNTARVIYHPDGLGGPYYTVQRMYANGVAKYHTCADSPFEAIKIADSFDYPAYPDLDLTIRGETYAERKECLRQIAKDWEWYQHPWSYYELAQWNDYFRTNGKRYGLLHEFEENGIL